jgi:hypothetical protein
VVANHATLGRPTIHEIAAQASAIISFEFRVKALMPFIVAHAVVSLLRLRAHTKKHEETTKQRDEIAASDESCHLIPPAEGAAPRIAQSLLRGGDPALFRSGRPMGCSCRK